MFTTSKKRKLLKRMIYDPLRTSCVEVERIFTFDNSETCMIIQFELTVV